MKSFLTLLAISGLALPALAQDAAADWTMVNEPAQGVTAAVASFDSGIGIAVRCMKGGMGVVIGGLPPQGGDRRTLRIGFEDGPVRDYTWVATVDPTAAVTEFPSPLARRLRQGGVMNVVVPGAAEGGRNLRHVLNLPPSATAIESVLTACGKPLVDPRDAELDPGAPAGLPEGMNWTRAPRPDYPRQAEFARIGSGYVVMSCNTQADGSLKACEAESEHPLGVGFGRAAVDSMERARVGWRGDHQTPVGGRRVFFRVNFRW